MSVPQCHVQMVGTVLMRLMAIHAPVHLDMMVITAQIVCPFNFYKLYFDLRNPFYMPVLKTRRIMVTPTAGRIQKCVRSLRQTVFIGFL